MKGLLLVTIILCSSFVLASDYSIHFNQIGDKIVIEEFFDGVRNLSYLDNVSLEKSKSGYIFLKKIVFPGNFDSAIILLELDSGFILGSSGAYPQEYITKTDGHTISLEWNRTNVKEGESIAIFASLEKLGSDFFIGYSILFIILFTIIIYLVFKKRAKTNKKGIDKHLLDIERKILEELRHADRHELWQKNIQAKLNLSKAKTSRVIRNLEARGLIEKIPFGNTNKIVLK